MTNEEPKPTLGQEAEQNLSQDSVPDFIEPCFACTNDAVYYCRKCKAKFCSDHASSLDKRLCSNCVSTGLEILEESPLVDEAGVTHSGRSLKLIGEGWPNTLDL